MGRRSAAPESAKVVTGLRSGFGKELNFRDRDSPAPAEQGTEGRAVARPARLESIACAPLPAHILEDPFSPIPEAFISRPELRVAAIADEISWRCWQYEAQLVPLRTDDWQARLSEGHFDLLFVESAWEGPGGDWGRHLYGLPRRSRRSEDLLGLIVDFCRKRDIPTVFYSKEDPVDRRGFLAAAERFDFVFTTDEDSMAYYERKLGHDRVACLPFAAQPRIHNPDRLTGKRDGGVFFAGTWYAKRHRQRRKQAASILKPALDYGLEILDRVELRADPDYAWPPEYHAAMVGSLPYTRMVEANKHYRVGLNLNSVTRSPTMLSRRVFELLASGTPVISSPSAAISRFFGDDVVLVSESAADTREQIEKLTSDDEYWRELSERGVSRIRAGLTYSRRLDHVLEQIGRGGHAEPRGDSEGPS